MGRRNSNTKLDPLGSSSDKIHDATNNPTGGGRIGLNGGKRITDKKMLVEAVRKLAPAYSTSLPLEPHRMKNKDSDSKKEEEEGIFAQLRVVESGVNTTIRKYNEEKLKADRKAEELREKLDVLAALKIDNDALEDMKKKQNPESIRIHELNNEIHEMELEIERKLHYRRQLEYMMKRLDKNQVSYDAHLNSMEDTIAGMKKEFAQIQELHQHLKHGRAKAFNDLMDAEIFIAGEVKTRAKMAHWRGLERKNANRMEEWRKERELMQQELMAELKGDMSKDEEQILKNKKELGEKIKDDLQKKNSERHKIMIELDENFRQLQQVTGVNTFEEMLEKYHAQESNTEALANEKDIADRKLDYIKLARDEAQKNFRTIRASGVGSTELNRDILDKINVEILQARTEMKLNKAHRERLDVIIVDISQGTQGLRRRLQPYLHVFKEDSESNVFQNQPKRPTSQNSNESSIEESMESLNLTEIVYAKLTEMSGGENTRSRFGDANGSGGDDQTNSEIKDSNGQETTDLISLNKNNIRVRSSKKKTLQEVTGMDEKKSNEERDNEDNEKDYNANGDINIEDHEVLTRHIVKESAQKVYTDQVRKKEQANKRQRQKNKEAEESYSTRASSAKGSDKKIYFTKEAAEKLCHTSPPIGLPRGLTIRDDAITKSAVFLTAKPDLS